jgi:hypothetical protein
MRRCTVIVCPDVQLNQQMPDELLSSLPEQVKMRTAAAFELFKWHIQPALAAVTHSSAALIQQCVDALRKSGAVVTYAAMSSSLLTQVRSLRDADVSAGDVQRAAHLCGLIDRGNPAALSFEMRKLTAYRPLWTLFRLCGRRLKTSLIVTGITVLCTTIPVFVGAECKEGERQGTTRLHGACAKSEAGEVHLGQNEQNQGMLQRARQRICWRTADGFWCLCPVRYSTELPSGRLHLHYRRLQGAVHREHATDVCTCEMAVT